MHKHGALHSSAARACDRVPKPAHGAEAAGGPTATIVVNKPNDVIVVCSMSLVLWLQGGHCSEDLLPGGRKMGLQSYSCAAQ